jgi:hypothetical protein
MEDPAARHDPLERRRASVAGAALAFVAGLVAALVLVRAAIGSLPAWTLEEEGVARIKMRHLSEQADAYDTVFLGSSQVYRQVDVRLFDRELARAGVRVRSYNLGLPGMRFFEVVARANALLRRPPAGWKTLVIELPDADPDLRAENERSRRDLGWHTPTVTWLACRTVWSSPRGTLERLGLVRRHLYEGLLRASAAGEGLPALRAALGRVDAPDDETPGGYLPLELDAGPTSKERRRAFLEELTRNRAWLDQRLEGLREADSPPTAADLPPDAVQEALRGLVAHARARSVETVFVLLPPSDRRRREMLAARELGILPNLIDLEAPLAYPEFHRQLSLLQDENHLNAEGAGRMTVELARAFLALREESS